LELRGLALARQVLYDLSHSTTQHLYILTVRITEANIKFWNSYKGKMSNT
jgi:hypothetical protein